MAIKPSDAERIAKAHLDNLNLEYRTEYGAPKIVNNRFIDKNDRSKGTVPGEYKVPVTLTDKDGTTLKTEVYVDSQTGKVREGEYWNPTTEQFKAGMEGRKQHYVLVMTKDEAAAKTLADRLYNEEGVVSSAYGHRRVVDQMEAHAVMAFIHGEVHQSGPIDYKINPEEEQRRKSLEDCLLKIALR